MKLITILACVLPALSAAEGLTEPHGVHAGPYAVDGDTIDAEGKRVRLFGIDAPEINQTCQGIAVGRMAQAYLQALLDKGPLTCRSMGTDRYTRTLGVCSAAGIEINREMVRSGYAFAYVRYSHDYASEEAMAQGPVQLNHCANPEGFRHRAAPAITRSPPR